MDRTLADRPRPGHDLRGNDVSTTTLTEIEVVEAFLQALERLDVDAAMALADPDIVYQNVPFPPARGVDRTGRLLKAMMRFGTGFEARILNIAADGAVVLTERIDVLARGRFEATFWVCGTFEVRDGKVTLWRDRFDFADFTVACVKGVVRALRRR
jgi:limonene-1,2-epoxide hydrolase